MKFFNWVTLIPHVTEQTEHVMTALFAAFLLIVFAVAGRLALGNGQTAVEPAAKFSLKGFFELITEFVVGIADMVIGERGRKFVPMFAAVFFYIFINNCMSLLPGLTPPTDNVNATFAVGIFSFFVYNIYGFKENGIGYLKHFMGPILWLAPIMGAIEIISHLIRPLTLGLRLFGNILADHAMIAVFVQMFLKVWIIPVPAIFYGLGVFVCFMQAFIFMMLSMIYISLATAHEH